MLKCVVCKTNEATQEHHISYDPELTIDICVPCHDSTHKGHGVGRGRGQKKQLSKRDIFDFIDRPYRPSGIKGTLTCVEERENDFHYYVMSYATGEELEWLICPNKATELECTGSYFYIYGERSTGRVYGRCPSCGYDFEIRGITNAKE